MANATEPSPLPKGDPRLAVPAVLITSNGEVIGKASVLSSEIAVTTAEVAKLAQDKSAGLPPGSGSIATLMLTFPQFVGSPGVYPLSVYLHAIDQGLGFGVLRFSGALPLPLPPSLLGTGEIPAEGFACDVLYWDVGQKSFFQLSPGRVGRLVDQRLAFQVEWDAQPEGSWPLPLAGAPVFCDYRLVGIVAMGPLRGVPGPTSGPFIVEVLSVALMAQSAVTPIIRDLLPWIESDPNTPKPFPATARDKKFPDASGGAARSKEAATEEPEPQPAPPSDAELFARLSPSSRSVLERADGMRRSAGQGKVHMEYLIGGLFDKSDGPTQRLLASVKIDRPKLIQIIRETVGTDIPQYFVSDLTGIPLMSQHVREALIAAAKRAETTGSISIRSRHLLYGVLSVEDCKMVQALTNLGVNRDDLVSDEQAVADQSPPPMTEANPTPKVDSDLWSEEDRLGYEAYARTIASLITHKETKPPLTIGIKAPWGAGKTTLMKRVQHLLDGDAKLSEENRSGTMQQGQPSQVTLRELVKELKDSTTPARLEAKRSKDGEGYGLEARTTVWFNAWKYQTSEQLWAGMAHCIISQVTARMGVRERELFWLRLHARRVNADEVRRKVYEMIARQLLPLALLVGVAVAIVIWVATAIQFLMPYHLAIRVVSILAGLFTLVWKGWDKLGEKAAGTMRELIREPHYEGKMGYLHLVESDIREVLQLATAASVTKENPKGNPLVVFVDDLDRCAPNKVAEVVEAINLFLCGDYPNCIFVLGMEPGMVAAALEVANKDVIQKAEEMGLADRTAPVGWRFMEKIVQLPIMIPPPTEAGRQRYVNSLTGSGIENGGGVAVPLPNASSGAFGRMPVPRPALHGAEAEARVQSYIRRIGPALSAVEVAKRSEDVVAQAPQEERWAAQEAGNRVYEQTLSEHDPVMAGFAEEVSRLVEGNPRQIKRYVNVFRFYSTLRHSLRLEGLIPGEDLPSDKVLAKFVALSIQWPHAVDCLRVKTDLKTDGADGKKRTLLEFLETESKKVAGDDSATDAAWEKLVGKNGLGMAAWAEQRAFRQFLSRGESLCQKEGHGLW
jgi:hypothetical protein